MAWLVGCNTVEIGNCTMTFSKRQGWSDSFAINTLWGGDLSFEAEVWLDENATGSLIVRGNPSAMGGYRIYLNAKDGTVGMARMTAGQPEMMIQQRKVELPPDRWHKLKVVAQGAFFDVYVDDTLLIVRHERTYVDGCIGLHANGKVMFRNVQAYHYQGLQNTQADWVIRCQPRHLFP